MPPRRRGATSDDPSAIERREWMQNMRSNVVDHIKELDSDLEHTTRRKLVDLNAITQKFQREIRQQDNKVESGAKSTVISDESSGVHTDMESASKSDSLEPLATGDTVKAVASSVEMRAFSSFAMQLGEESAGRCTRIQEPALFYGLEIIANLVEALRITKFFETNIGTSEDKNNDDNRSTCPVQYAIFGHQVGAYLAYELVRELRLTSLVDVDHLFISDAIAPKLLSDYNEDWDTVKTYNASDTLFIDDMLRREAVVPPSLRERRDILKTFVPHFRTDRHTLETYDMQTNRSHPERPLPCTLTLFRFFANKDIRGSAYYSWDDILLPTGSPTDAPPAPPVLRVLLLPGGGPLVDGNHNLNQQTKAGIDSGGAAGKVTSRGRSNIVRVLDTIGKVCVDGAHKSMTEQYDDDGKEEEGDEDSGNFYRDEDEDDDNAHEVKSLFSDLLA